MADFSTFRARRRAFDAAASVVDRVLGVYSTAAAVRDVLAEYQAGTNPNLTAAIDAAFTPAQKQELAQIATLCAAFAADMEANHSGLVNLIS